MDPLNEVSFQLTDPDDAAVRPLIRAHLAHSRQGAPQASNHTLNGRELRGTGIRFWSMSIETGVVGCGALKFLPDGTAEVKSVHVAQAQRGRGLARLLVMHLIEVASGEGAKALVLETGTSKDYNAARALYGSLGFTECGPFPGYRLDPNSVFMRLPLDPGRQSPQ